MTIQDLLNECENAYWNADYNGLIGLCDEVLKRDPKNQIAMGYKSVSYCFLNSYEKALQILDEAIGLYPDNYYFKNNLAMVYYDLGEFEKSLECCDEGLEIKDFDWLCENKFKSLIMLERYDEAIEFEKTVSHDMNRHLIFMEDGLGEHELDYYYRLLKDSPDDFFIIDMIKMMSSKSGVRPEVGDYYLKWIHAVSCEAGEADSRCRQDFNVAGRHVHIECENPHLKEYAGFRMFLLHILLKDGTGDCLTLSRIRDKVLIYDGVEFDAFIRHLAEIGFIEKGERGCVRLAG